MSKLLKVARLQFLIVSFALFALGALWAVLLGAPLSPLQFLLGYLIILFAQLAVHFSNDYFDVETDQPGSPTLISGGGGVLLIHPELRTPVKWIALALILFSLGMGVFFMRHYAYPISILGYVVLGNLAGWCYSAPPFRLSHRGLGEVCYALVAGFLIPSMGYLVIRGYLDLNGLFFVIPLTLYGLASILTVEIPDADDDRLGNKMTWVARMGRGFGFSTVGWLLIAATAYFFLFPQFEASPIPFDFRIVGLFSLVPVFAGVLGMVRRPEQWKAATQLATAIVISLTVFAVLVDGYLFWLAFG